MVVSFSSLITSNSEAPHGQKQQCRVSDDDLVNSGKETIYADVRHGNIGIIQIFQID